MVLSSSNIKKILIFSKKKAFLIFFQKKACYTFRNETYTFWPNPQKFSLKNCLIFFPENTCSEKVCFCKRNIFSPSPKNKKIHPEKNSYGSGNRNAKKLIFFSKLFLYFRKKLYVLENQKNIYILFLYKEAKFSKN